MTHENDLIRRGDALAALEKAFLGAGNVGARTREAIADIPTVAASQPSDPVVKADCCQRVMVKPLVWGEDTDYSSETYGGITARPMQGFRYYIKRVYGGVWKLSGSVPFGQPDYPTIEAAKAAAQADYEARILAAIDTQPDPRDAVIARLGPIAEFLPDAVAAAEKAMRKFPQPNYVISKWAEETGEVTKDLIHMAEGRQTPDKLRGEIVQALAMLHRLLIEGDQVHGLPPLAESFAAAKGGAA